MSDFEFHPDFERQLRQAIEHELIRPIADGIRDDAQRFAPVDQGDLQGSIEVDVPAYDTALIGSDLEYAAATELGSGPHRIRARRKKVLSDGDQVFGKDVNHPGTPAQPYLRPALYKERTI